MSHLDFCLLYFQYYVTKQKAGSSKNCRRHRRILLGSGAGDQRLNTKIYINRRMGMLSFKDCNASLTDFATVLIIGGRKHDHKLRRTAARNYITLAQRLAQMLFQIVHCHGKALARNLTTLPAFECQQRCMDHLTAANNGPCLRLIQFLEEIIVADKSSGDLVLLAKLFLRCFRRNNIRVPCGIHGLLV